MIACVDVDYRETGAVAACLLLRNWSDEVPVAELVETIAAVEPYEPGQFYKRELPCLLAVLRRVSEPLDVVIVDSYVWLADGTTPGMGAHLWEALGRTVPIVGVAKTQFLSAPAREVLRGESQRPLYVTAVGIDVETVAARVREMHGPYRIPTALKRVDQLCRGRGS
jgi:deoxyribonuclease V